ncbi:hypothetical protein CDL15_Pgr009097 [Punica granatum]|uniref:11-beta-hydroxysteroid dehydrogenase 1B-like n=1 Tax=Punica granatum TaxID=22663 RepID=A0A218VY47_PUNGR|nr:hypothetical protein CDL15_Pgr009097 [Punica granatum]
MEIIHKFLNLVAPPFTFFSLCFLLPPLYTFRFFLFALTSIISEDLAGKYLAYEYARRGACLALVARREASLREVADRAHDFGAPDVAVIPADVSKVDDCKRLVNETINHYGRLDHLVNNAGIHSICKFEDVTDVITFRAVMDTNYWGSVYTTRFAVPYLRNSRGKIVVLSSSASWLPAPRTSFYNASKAALSSMFETLRVELGPEIGITIVTPGFIESELTRGKYWSREGKLEVDRDMRDVLVGMMPVGLAEGCAKSIVNSACRGDRYLTEPSWFKATYLWKVFCPELVEWSYRMMFLASPGAPPTEAPSKKMVDLLGAKKLLYPGTIQTPEVKTD